MDAVLRISPHDYLVVAGRPSMGKTHFALSLLGALARTHGPTLMVSVEMGEDSMAERLASSEGPLVGDQGAIQSAWMEAIDRWDCVPMRIDTWAKTLQQVVSSIRVAKQRYGIVAAAVDYLQLMRLPKAESREQAVALASRELCLLAKELGIVVLALSQLNRGCESRDDKRPLLSDLRESGSIEQDADSVLMLYREAAYNPATPRPEECEIIVRKQRNGQQRTALLAFRPGHGWFEDLNGGPVRDLGRRIMGERE